MADRKTLVGELAALMESGELVVTTGSDKKEVKEKELKNVKTVFSETDDQIIIPKRMTKLEAAQELELQHAEEEKVVEKIKMFEG